jgi:PKD domain/Secretion system C-terminal sorting domain
MKQFFLSSLCLCALGLFAQVNDPYIMVGSFRKVLGGIPPNPQTYKFDFRQNNLRIDTFFVPIGVWGTKIGEGWMGWNTITHNNKHLYFTNGVRALNAENKVITGADSLSRCSDPMIGEVGLVYYVVRANDSTYIHLNSQALSSDTATCFSSIYCSDHFLHVYIVDTSTNVVRLKTKKKVFLTSWNNEISAPVRHANGRDWLFAHLNANIENNFLHPLELNTWVLQNDSVSKFPTNTTIQWPFLRNGRGLSAAQKGFSLDGSKYYWCETAGCMVFDYDRCTGFFSNMRVIDALPGDSFGEKFSFGGANFSPNNRFFYCTYSHVVENTPTAIDFLQINDYLLQYDLDAPNLSASVDTIAVSDSLINPGYSIFSKGQEFMSLSYAPDGQLWLPSGYNNISLIEHPDSAGQGCGFISRWIDNIPFNASDFRTVNHKLGPIDNSPCDTLGLNNDPRADYRWKTDDCLTIKFRNTSWHEPTSYFWDFGDGTTSTQREPVHTYPEKAFYKACLTVSNQYGSNTFCRDIDLYQCQIIDTKQPQPLVGGEAQLFPNPTRGPLQLRYKLHAGRYDGQLKITDITGREVLSRSLKVHETSYLFDISVMPAGIYFWSLTDGAGSIGSGKVVKME